MGHSRIVPAEDLVESGRRKMSPRGKEDGAAGSRQTRLIFYSALEKKRDQIKSNGENRLFGDVGSGRRCRFP